LLASVKNHLIFVGESTQIRYQGGSGTGSVNYSALNKEICVVDKSGIVTGMAQGVCLVSVNKAGANRYMSAISNLVAINVSTSPQSALQANSNRNWLIYLQQAQGYAVLVNLSSGYANSLVDLQLRKYMRGKYVYVSLGNIALDEKGDAVFTGEKSLLKGSRLRAVIQGSNIKYGTTI
jgi:hypothetical protein